MTSDPPIPNRPMFRPEEVYPILAVSRSTLYAMLSRGELGIRVGGQWRIRRWELVALLDGAGTGRGHSPQTR